MPPIFNLLALRVGVGCNANSSVRIWGNAHFSIFKYQHVGIPNAKLWIQCHWFCITVKYRLIFVKLLLVDTPFVSRFPPVKPLKGQDLEHVLQKVHLSSQFQFCNFAFFCSYFVLLSAHLSCLIFKCLQCFPVLSYVGVYVNLYHVFVNYECCSLVQNSS